MTTAILALLLEVGQAYGLPTGLLEAIAWTESRGSPEASNGRDRGLMQLSPVIRKRYGVRDPLDPRASAEGAARYLVWAREKGKTWNRAVRIYGCGWAGRNRCQAYRDRVFSKWRSNSY